MRTWPSHGLQEAARNGTQHELVPETSLNGHTQPNEAAENAMRDEEGVIRIWKVLDGAKLGDRMDTRHAELLWLVMV